MVDTKHLSILLLGQSSLECAAWDVNKKGLVLIYMCVCVFPASSVGEESACNAGDLGSIPGLRSVPGGGHGNQFKYSLLENPHGQRSLVGYSPWGRKEQDTTEQLNTLCKISRYPQQRTSQRLWHEYPRSMAKRVLTWMDSLNSVLHDPVLEACLLFCKV